MGSPLAPILANIFMRSHEKYWIKKTQAVKPVFCKRYVDDIFAVLKSELDAVYILYILKYFVYI